MSALINVDLPAFGLPIIATYHTFFSVVKSDVDSRISSKFSSFINYGIITTITHS